ncbi:hypothetical protein PUV54_16595 [Hyphococcus flavus]|uniref:Uncharacterized protein n=1 Tax=Hyphococcus flavus TaxID=1866326 RepID=A0AAF0CH72_9PROT|nr:hypothetical protein [Hyphococcus flavus]WDI31572.1 hypothetical protein PUV54_16595 [Hyphococcus flavus]
MAHKMTDLIAYGARAGHKIDGQTVVVPALPITKENYGAWWQLIRDAWLVLRGRAAAIQWPQHDKKQGPAK